MKLNMFLDKEVYIGSQYSYNGIQGELNIYKNDKKIDLPLDNLESLVYRQATWNDAMQIHRWFLRNVQDGVDDGGRYIVSKKEIQELLKECKEVLGSKDTEAAKELLPVGDEDEDSIFNDEYKKEIYYKQIKDTIIQLETIEYDNLYDGIFIDYYYQTDR